MTVRIRLKVPLADVQADPLFTDKLEDAFAKALLIEQTQCATGCMND